MKLLNKIKGHTTKGKFKWSDYCKSGNHDHKFGPTKWEYMAQMPIVGLAVLPLSYMLLYLSYIPVLIILKVCERIDETKEKSSRKGS